MSKDKKKHSMSLLEHKRQLKRSKQKAGRELANSEYLTPFKEVIYEEYRPQNVSLYRWGHHPNIGDDFLPQIFQEVNPMSADMLKVPSVDAPKDVILNYTSSFTLSNFTSLEDAVSEWQSNLKKRLKKAKPGGRDKAIRQWIDKKGQYVMKIDYTEDSGLVGPQNDGIHKEFFPFSGVDVASLVDKSFEPYKIEIQ